MTRSTSAVLEPVIDEGASLPPPPPLHGDRPPGPASVDTAPPPVSNARLAMLAFIVFESMLFAGLLGGYVVLRWGSAVWPPAGQPYLPIAVTWLNTAILLGSCVPLRGAARALGRGDGRRFIRGLLLTSLLGSLFLAIQGFEWIRLLAHGLTVTNGTYGASFLMLIGAHGLHVLGAVVWLATVAILAAAGRIGHESSAAVDISIMYWRFVCAVWIVLFMMVYLA